MSGAAKDWRHPNKTNPKATSFMLSEAIFNLFCFLGTETLLDLICICLLDGTQKHSIYSESVAGSCITEKKNEVCKKTSRAN